MFCFNCGIKILESYNVCPNCGIWLKEPPVPPVPPVPDNDLDEVIAVIMKKNLASAPATPDSGPLSMLVSYMAGSVWDTGQAPNGGKITVDEEGVRFQNNRASGYAGDHSYTFGEIKNTEFCVRQINSTSVSGYVVTLKNGNSHSYCYTVPQSKTIHKIDEYIREHMNKSGGQIQTSD